MEVDEFKEVVSGKVATMKEEMGSTLKEELRLFKREIREEIESGTKAANDKVVKKATPTPPPRHSLYNEKVNEEKFDNSSWIEGVKGRL